MNAWRRAESSIPKDHIQLTGSETVFVRRDEDLNVHTVLPVSSALAAWLFQQSIQESSVPVTAICSNLGAAIRAKCVVQRLCRSHQSYSSAQRPHVQPQAARGLRWDLDLRCARPVGCNVVLASSLIFKAACDKKRPTHFGLSRLWQTAKRRSNPVALGQRYMVEVQGM